MFWQNRRERCIINVQKAVIPAIKLEIKKDGAILFIIAPFIILGGKMIQRLKLVKVDFIGLQ